MKSQKEITTESYNKTANEYFSVVSKFDMLPEILDFAGSIEKNGKILDLGCGPGHHSKYFKDLGFKVTGIDLSQNMISIAKENFKNIDFKVMDIYNLKFDSNTFNGIWASASLLHIEKSNIKEVLIKLKDILTVNGTIYISLKIGDTEEMIIDDRYNNNPKFYSFFQTDEIKKILKEVGFNVVKSEVVEKRNYYDTNKWFHLFVKKHK